MPIHRQAFNFFNHKVYKLLCIFIKSRFHNFVWLPLLSDADAASLSRFLASHRVDLLRMEERQKSLEDLFLELTGREESL